MINCGAPFGALHTFTERAEMSDKTRRLGDNQNPIQDEAINFVQNIYESLIAQKKHCEDAVLGKNKTVRDNAAMNSVAQINIVLKELKPWNEVIEAKLNGEDIHSAPIKSSKLDIVAGSEHKFGQYIIDKEIK